MVNEAMPQAINRCYIAAPVSVDTSLLRRCLIERGVAVVSPDQFQVGTSISASVQDSIASADLVVGVITRGRSSDSVLFELGMATALGKPVMLISSAATSVHSSLPGLLVLRATPNNAEAINFAIDQILTASPERPSQSPTPKSSGRSLGKRADHFLDRLRDSSEIALERLVEDLIRESGTELVVPSPEKRQTVDFAIWSDALQPVVGNPFLIEVKTNYRSTLETLTAAKQLSKFVVNSGAQWGLLLYKNGVEGDRNRRSLPPNIIVMSLRTLIEAMRSRSFVDVIKAERNASVHGAY